MKIKAAIMRQVETPWEIVEVDLGDPVPGEVQVRLAASGLCHSDEHLMTGATPLAQLPIVGGHEGAGVVTKIGEGVTDVEVGDHVVLAFTPACGKCLPCAKGLQNLCDNGADLITGRAIADGTCRVSLDGEPVITMCLLGTFAPYVTVHESSVIRIEKDIPLEKAALLGCGVSTGWGSATHIGKTRPGQTVIVVGVGGVGINAVQGAAAAGARFVIAVDPVDFKRKKAIDFGATHTFESMDEALIELPDITWGRMADLVILTVGHLTGDQIQPALWLTGKGGQVVVTGMGSFADNDVKVNLAELTLLQKNIQGAIFGGTGPRNQIPELLHYYRSGKLKLDELITNTYRLEDINRGFQDMRDGKNIRGVIVYDEQDY